MENIVVAPKVRENVKFQYNGAEIEVNPYITVEEEVELISNYVNAYFYPNQDSSFGYLKEGNFDYWQANYGLIQKIMTDKTNVDVEYGQTHADEMIELFYEVVSHISNYRFFKSRLDKTVESIKDSKSIGIVIDGLVTKIQDILSSFQNIDPEELKKLADSLIGKMENSSVSEIFNESAKQSKPNKTRKTKEIKA